MFEKYLEELGLTDKEAALYLTLLSVDHSSVLDLAKKTKIKRPTVYVTLESLAKKGLVSETQVGKKAHYQAEPPERLETYVENKRIALEEQGKRLKDIIPQMRSMERASGERPVVKYFEGRGGIMSSYEDFFTNAEPGGTAYMVYPRDLVDEIFTENERKKYRELRQTKKINNKVIYTYNKGELASDETSERMRVDPDEYPILCDIGIYGDEVRISVVRKALSAIFIKSPDVADTLKTIFRLAFENLSRKNKSQK